MVAKRYAVDLKSRVAKLRSTGKTYAEIQKVFSIPKSTLSVWLGKRYRGVFDRNAQLEHLKRARLIAARILRERKIQRDSISEAKGIDAARLLPLQDVGFRKSLLAMLYWAEGSKHKKASGLTFTNTDPRLAVLYITLLRSCFLIDEKRLRIRLHVHHYHNKKEAVRFWSQLLHVSPDQFGKLHVKKRSTRRKFRRNFMGICFISYGNTSMLKEVLAFGYAIQDLINKSPTMPLAGIEPAFHPSQGCVLSIERQEPTREM